MALLVVEQQKRPAAQDHTQTPDESSWDEHVTVDSEAQAIHIAGKRVGVFGFSWVLGRMKDAGGPAREGICQAFGARSLGHLRQKGFGIPIAIGVRPSAEPT